MDTEFISETLLFNAALLILAFRELEDVEFSMMMDITPEKMSLNTKCTTTLEAIVDLEG